jgi:hypothetical protein
MRYGRKAKEEKKQQNTHLSVLDEEDELGDAAAVAGGHAIDLVHDQRRGTRGGRGRRRRAFVAEVLVHALVAGHLRYVLLQRLLAACVRRVELYHLVS